MLVSLASSRVLFFCASVVVMNLIWVYSCGRLIFVFGDKC